MNKKFLLFVFILVLFIGGSVYARETGNAGMITQGSIRTCLLPKLQGSPPPAWFKRAQVDVQLTGTCEAASCQIVRCNSNNKEIEENENFEKKCKAGKIGNPNCADKLDDNQKKIEKSVEKKPGCKTIGFTNGGTVVAMGGQNSNVLGTTSAQEVPNGPVNILTQEGDYTAHVQYTYYAVGTVPPTAKGGDTEVASAGANNTQQLAQIGFTFVDTQVTSKSKDCTMITWDPYGRAFDAVSLEPMEDVEVTLSDSTGKPAIQQFESNSDTTDMSGLFNILVEKPGMYSMTIQGPSTHQFISTPKLSQNYSSIYSDLYSPAKVFEEVQGVATHHDIPLQPKGEPYTGAVAEVMTADEAVDMGDFIVYSGKSSFPFSRVCMVTELGRTRIGECTYADKFGEYSISIGKEEIPLEALVPQAAKVKLTDPAWKDSVYAPVENYDVKIYEPILNHIEGIAYDENKKPVPFATIQIKQKMDDAVVYETVADEKGFFIVYSSDLPVFEYYIDITTPSTSQHSIKTTSQFVKENTDYITDNKLNLLLAKRDGVVINKPTNAELETAASTNKKNQKSYVTLSKMSEENKNSLSSRLFENKSITMIVIGATLVVLILIAVALFIKAKK
ncbi:MAG: hypothetical protein WA061_03730 [Microgenomates group bacterium]